MTQQKKGKYNELDESGRLAALSMLVDMARFRTIEPRDMKFVAVNFRTNQWAVAHLWIGSKTQREGVLHKEDAKYKRHNCQPQRKWNPEEVQEALKELPFNERKTVRLAAAKLGMSHSTLQYMKKHIVIERKRSSLKPYLTDKNKMWSNYKALGWILRSRHACRGMGMVLLQCVTWNYLRPGRHGLVPTTIRMKCPWACLYVMKGMQMTWF